MSSRLITALDIALRDRRASVGAWIRWRASGLKQQGRLHTVWDGLTVSGEPVPAFVNRSRWVAACPYCRGIEYVCPDTPVFFCLRCGNNDSEHALPVDFPEERERIEAALLARPVKAGRGANQIEILLHAPDGLDGLSRSWAPDVSVETLEIENRERGVA